MPELPEVEVSRMGISPHVIDQTVKEIIIRNPRLRWPIPEAIKAIEGQVIRGGNSKSQILAVRN